MTFVSYAQNFEDVVLWRAFRTIGEGFYIDAGAADPDVDSVTRAFYDRGWRGINIEPVSAQHRRLQAARERDINLAVAVGERSGRADLFFGMHPTLSTLVRDLAPEAAPPVTVEVMTLGEICRRHAPPDIHFLKIDVEGSERTALAGADFTAFRPWVVLVEATEPNSEIASHAAWDDILLTQGYDFVLFDGLNRFYVAAERYAELAPHFRVGANVFDDFMRAADSDGGARIAAAERETAAVRDRLARREARMAAQQANHAAFREAAARRFARHEDDHAATIEAADRRLHLLLDMLGAKQREVDLAQEWLHAMRTSTSWQVTGPLRQLGRLRGARTTDRPPTADRFDRDTALTMRLPEPEKPAPPAHPLARGAAVRNGPRRIVHQFHSGSAEGDAITQAMLLTRDLLRAMGFISDIFVQHLDPALADQLRGVDELPNHPDYVLIVRHSMGHTILDRVVAAPATKILLYHNITPAEFLNRAPVLKHFARVGRDQLAQLRDHVVGALADSEYNAIELRRLGYDTVWACPLLFDIDAIRARATAQPVTRGTEIFTILFVGRLMESKAQDALIAAYAAFRRHYRAASRLVLVGRVDAAADDFMLRINELIADENLGDDVTITGMVSDDGVRTWYNAADLYVSLSRHEGFGVPLVEAMAHGVPVLAWPSGAVAYTLEGAAELVTDREPASVGAQMAALAASARRRALLAQRQSARLDRFRLEHHLPRLRQALALAGAAPPADIAQAAPALAANLRFTITGHVNKSYSLAAINRTLALGLEDMRPGSVRLLPVETHATTDLSDVPAAVHGRIAALAARPPHDSGPELVISQHYPVHVPSHGGDVRAALFFWEESLVPPATIAVLNRGFDGVLAPSDFVAKTLIDSGLSIPVRLINNVPGLEPMRRLAATRRRRWTTGEGRRFTFLHVSSCFPRKGADVLLAAFVRAFGPDDPVRLIIKTFPNPHNRIADDLAALRDRTPELPAIELIDEDVPDAALLRLYADADAVVLPTRGEGLNLPAAEAMAAGLPLIVTGFGGHMDFCDSGNAVLVDYRLVPSKSHLATPHALWAEPDEWDLAAALRRAVGDPDAATRIRHGIETADRLADPATMALTVSDAGLDLLLTPPPAAPRIVLVSTWQKRCGVAEYVRHLLDALEEPVERLTILCDLDTPAPGPFADGITFRPTWRIGLHDGVAPLTTAIAVEDPDIVLVQHQPGLFSWPRLSELLAAPALSGRLIVVALHNTRHLLEMTDAVRDTAVDVLGRAARVLVHTIDDLNRLHRLGLRLNVTLLPHGVAATLRQGEVAVRRDDVAAMQRHGDIATQRNRDIAVRRQGDTAGRRDDRTAPLRDEEGAPAPQAVGPVIGCYGFFLPGKGIPQLIAAAAALRARHPTLQLRLINAEYPSHLSAREIAYCQALADELGVDVEWQTEFLEDRASLAKLAGCDIIVLPYQQSLEASSAALRTALAADVPVAVTPLPLFDEAEDAVIRLGGIDAPSIADGLAALLADPERQDNARDSARRWLAARDWRDIAARLFGMLGGLHRTALCDSTRRLRAAAEVTNAADTVIDFTRPESLPTSSRR